MKFSQLDRYLARSVWLGSLAALAGLVLLDAFFSLLREIRLVGVGDYDLLEVLIYIALTLPRRGWEMAPYACLIGSLFTLGELAIHGELNAFRAAGVSPLRMGSSVVVSGGVLLLIVALIGELVAPQLDHHAANRRAIAKSQSSVFQSIHGVWLRDGERYINVRDIFPGGRLAGVLIYEFDRDKRLQRAVSARGAIYQEGRWWLEGIAVSHISEEKVTVEHQARTDWGELLNPDLIDIVTVPPERLSAIGLWRYVAYLERNGLDSDHYRHALWRRLGMPLVGLAMLSVVVPFTLGRVRQAAAGLRLLLGILLGIGFYILNQTLGHIGQINDFDPLLSVSLPSLLFVAVVLLVARR